MNIEMLMIWSAWEKIVVIKFNSVKVDLEYYTRYIELVFVFNY